MNNDELDSQLSAMFDGELPAPECELLARRLARDDVLKARWGRYASIGAAIRMERGVRLNGRLVERISAAVEAEPALLVAASQSNAARLVGPSLSRWWQPVAGAAVAAGVAATAILWLRAGVPDGAVVAGSPPRPSLPAFRPVAASPSTPATYDYVVPPSVGSPSAAPPMELADFVVAHSEFSMPLLRRSALTALVGAESASEPADTTRSAQPTDTTRSAEPTNPPPESNSHADTAR